MKKVIKIFLWIVFFLFMISFLASIVMEILRYIPFSKNDTFDLFWNIFFYSSYILAIQLVIAIMITIKKKR